MNKISYRSLFLLVYFQLSWYFTVVLIVSKKDMFSFIFSFFGLIMMYVFRKPSTSQFFKIIFLGLLGMSWDLILFKTGVLKFSEQFPVGMFSIWISFSTVIQIYVQMFKNKKYIGGAVMSLCGPISYFAAQKFTVLKISPDWFFILLCLFWYLYFLLSYHVLVTEEK